MSNGTLELLTYPSLWQLCWSCPTTDLCLRSVSEAQTASSTWQLPDCNFGTQLETDASCECFSSKCLLILEDLKTDVKLLTGKGQGEAEEKKMANLL